MKKLVLFFALFTSVSFAGFSQTKQENIKEMLKLMQVEQMISKSYEGMIPMIQKQMESQVGASMTEKKKENQRKVLTKVMDLSKEMATDLINNEAPGIYDRNFTEDEIKELMTFYKSPIGKKSIELMPNIQKELMGVMLSKYLPNFQMKVKALMDEAKEEGTK